MYGIKSSLASGTPVPSKSGLCLIHTEERIVLMSLPLACGIPTRSHNGLGFRISQREPSSRSNRRVRSTVRCSWSCLLDGDTEVRWRTGIDVADHGSLWLVDC